MVPKNLERRVRERAWAHLRWPQSWVQVSWREPRLLWPGRLRACLPSQKPVLSTIQVVGTVLASVVGGLATKLGRLTAPVVERLRENREQRIKVRAYLLWKQAGCPVGRDLDFWRQASRLEPRWLWPSRLRAWLGPQKNALSASTSRMRTSVRADTLAAIASAVGVRCCGSLCADVCSSPGEYI
jgi:hypothetical protein